MITTITIDDEDNSVTVDVDRDLDLGLMSQVSTSKGEMVAFILHPNFRELMAKTPQELQSMYLDVMKGMRSND